MQDEDRNSSEYWESEGYLVEKLCFNNLYDLRLAIAESVPMKMLMTSIIYCWIEDTVLGYMLYFVIDEAYDL